MVNVRTWYILNALVQSNAEPRMFQSHKNRKRGAITGTRLKKGSSQIILAQFGDQPIQTAYASSKSADRPPQKLEERKIAENDAWVS